MPAKKTSEAKDQPKAGKSTSNQAQEFNNVDPENAKGTKNTGTIQGSVKSIDKNDGLAPLNARQQRFVDEYLIDLNGTRAAIAAGYSEKTATEIASENLGKPNIAAAIQAARQKTATKLEITRERVLMEYARLAFVDPRAFYKEDGSIKNVPEMDADTAAALVGFEVDEIKLDGDGPSIGQTRKIKWADKKAALDSINRMMGWNQDKLKLQGDENAPIQMATRVVMVPAKQTAETITRPLEQSGD